MYFNATSNSIKIWLTTVTCILLLYETLKYQCNLLFNFQLRILMGILFISSLFSHYYTWWVYVNYWNDDFYRQWNHQLFFTITEIISTSLVLHMSNKNNRIIPKKIIIVMSIALIHILAGGVDQFIVNIFYGEGDTHQILRDLAFIVPDILHLILPIVQYYNYHKGQIHLHNFKNDIILMFFLIFFGFFLCYIL